MPLKRSEDVLLSGRVGSVGGSMGDKRHAKHPAISEYFGSNSFGPEAMKAYLPREVLRKFQESVSTGKKLEPAVADAVARGMKNWAMEKGATHYCHWFQPMTGSTAEKHDSFLSLTPSGAIEMFTGEQLVRAEPDASSFPSGGLRVTFEARGYTAWDPASPAFVVPAGRGATLCIPTVFVSYTGETLDEKAPLLRSGEALNRAALEILRYFKSPAKRVFSTLGAEQEYFLIDESYWRRRPDLVLAGRTLFGASSPKDQQLEDHYFGSIKERVLAFMTEAETELYKLGVPLKTRHNEVAPNQFECAPVFEEADVATDHNQLVMDVFRRVAARHGLAALFYEKPFGGINGSGKHLNWSLSTDAGKNLLAPGDTPQENLQFLIFLVSIIKAVKDHGPLLRAAVASSGNDHRLGANEAPPAIISVFLGAQLTKVLDDIERGATTKETETEWLDLGIDRIPAVLKDNTDRNRTSPFAFTGNKFEFRAVGSSFNTALPIAVLNTIVAHQLGQTKKDIDRGVKKGQSFKEAALEVLRGYYAKSKAVCFEGNNYSEEWVAEAKRRGLQNVKDTPEALAGFVRKDSLSVFEKLGVLSRSETESRYHIKLEKYAKDLDIEGKLYAEMVHTHMIPAAVHYQNELIAGVKGLKELAVDSAIVQSQTDLLQDISRRIDILRRGAAELKEALAHARKIEDARERALAYARKVKPLFEPLRQAADALEGLLPDKLWPLPKYRDMLFLL